MRLVSKFLFLSFAHLVLAALLLVVSAGVSFAGEEGGAALFGIIPSVFDQKRSMDEDIVILSNNEVLRGTVLTEEFSVTAPYGEVKIALRRLAGISFKSAQASTEALVTVNYNRVTGVIRERAIKFKISTSGTEMEIRKDKVRFLVLKGDPAETAFLDPKKKTDLFVMTNGDQLTGLAVEKSLKLQADYGDVSVGFTEISSIEMQGGRNVTAVLKKTNGDVMRGLLLTEELALALDFGAKVEKVYKDKFAKINVGDGNAQAGAVFGIAQPVHGESDGVRKVLAPEGDVVTNTIGMKLKLIKPGSFQMGSSKGNPKEDEKPVHKVTISKPFYMGIYEVTQAEYLAIMGGYPAKFQNPEGPVESVSWEEAVTFCQELSEKEKSTYRLPTEAEWEYACRAGTTSEYWWGEVFNGDCAWGKDNSSDKTHGVGKKKANPWGLCDMSGNVWEWCSDWYGDMYLPGDQTDPTGPGNGEWRVVRGGSWDREPQFLRSTYRSNGAPSLQYDNIGFRVVCAVSAR